MVSGVGAMQQLCAAPCVQTCGFTDSCIYARYACMPKQPPCLMWHPFDCMHPYHHVSPPTSLHLSFATAGYKVTIAINRPPPQLTAVFEDVIAVAPAATSQVTARAIGHCTHAPLALICVASGQCKCWACMALWRCYSLAPEAQQRAGHHMGETHKHMNLPRNMC